MASGWLNTKHRRFNDQTPLEIMMKEGTPGLSKIRSELDCTYAWSEN